MDKKPKKKVFAFKALIEGRIIKGRVSFSPAPQPGIMNELARFEAQRILGQLVTEDIKAGLL